MNLARTATNQNLRSIQAEIVRQLAEGLSIDPSGRAFAEIRGLNKEFASPHKVSAFVAKLIRKNLRQSRRAGEKDACRAQAEPCREERFCGDPRNQEPECELDKD